MNLSFSIRPAEEADTPLILRFIRELAEYEHLLQEVVADEDTLRTWIFQKNGAQVLIAQEGSEPVGFALYFHNFSTFLGRCGLYLEDLYICPEHRGKGYGLALLKRLAAITVSEDTVTFREAGRAAAAVWSGGVWTGISPPLIFTVLFPPNPWRIGPSTVWQGKPSPI